MSLWQLHIRHAHRDTADRDLDNGLNEKGRRQGDELVRVLGLLRPSKKPKRVLSSPKVRCLETAEFVARWAGVDVEQETILDEQAPKESSRDFEKRVQKLVDSFKNESQIVFVSHGDLLPLVVRAYGGFEKDVKKGDFFLIEDGRVVLFNGVRSERGNAGK